MAKPRAVRTLPIVKVYWIDAHQHSSGWIDAEEFEDWLAEPGLMISTGVLLARTKRWVALAMSIGSDTIADCLKIPAGMVQRVERLGKITCQDMHLNHILK